VNPTKKLLALFAKEQLDGLSLLDVGGGVGVIQRELMKTGVARATDVDASQAYLKVAREEAARQHHDTTFLHGNFTAVAEGLEVHDIVTLDKVICCYPDAEDLVTKAVDKARRYVGLIFPRRNLPARLATWSGNLVVWFQARGFRAYLHNPERIHGIVTSRGFNRVGEDRTTEWQVWLYRMDPPT
jgi:magnesium-protoporphyrin O-methyltransferase